MDDQGINLWLKDSYGSTIEGYPLFRLIWSTNVTEVRKGTFRDYYGELIIREVTEVRQCLKYPFAQNRWIIEVIKDTPSEVYGKELFQKYTYEGIYVFETKEKKRLPLNLDMTQAAIKLYFLHKGLTWEERINMRIAAVIAKEKARKEKYRDYIGDKLRSPLFFVLE